MEYTEKEWKSKITNLYGEKVRNWKVKCPACGRINTGAEFKELGAKPNDLITKCIGNFTGQGEPDPENNEKGCNWKAYGLFRIGDVIIMEDGTEVDVFPMVEV